MKFESDRGKIKGIVILAAVLSAVVCANIFPANAMASDDRSGVCISFMLEYDKGLDALIPVAATDIFVSSVGSLYAYDDGGYFLLKKAVDTCGNLYVMHISYGPKSHFINENDLQKTREALSGFAQANGIKIRSYGAITEKYRQCNGQLPASGLAGLLYPAEVVV
jgi:hypothetical protein